MASSDRSRNEVHHPKQYLTWELVNRLQQKRVIGCRMVLRNKLKADGTIEKWKARLVAQGCSQQPGIHFSDTFAPVARSSSIRLMASLAAQFNMKIRQFDIATAYLNSELDGEIFVDVPKSFENILQSVFDLEGGNEIGRKAKGMLSVFIKQIKEIPIRIASGGEKLVCQVRPSTEKSQSNPHQVRPLSIPDWFREGLNDDCHLRG